MKLYGSLQNLVSPIFILFIGHDLCMCLEAFLVCFGFLMYF